MKKFRKLGVVVLFLSLLLLDATAVLAQSTQQMIVSSGATASVLSYDGASGGFLTSLVPSGSGGLTEPRGITFGPDRNLYVVSEASNSILRFDGITGAFIDVFVSSGSGGLSSPSGVAFGLDGNLYVLSSATNFVLRYDGTTGAFLGSFASVGLSSPTALIFGSDGFFYVANQGSNTVARYSVGTGLFNKYFVTTGSGGLSAPKGVTFGPDGNLYVSSSGTNSILRYQAVSGVFLGIFASGNGLSSPEGLTFGPDGDLYVVSAGNNSVLKFNGSTGAFINTFVASGSGGLSQPHSLAFSPAPPNTPPVALPGYNQSVSEGATVMLNGSASFDPDGDPLTYQWTQTAGPTVVLDLTNPAAPTFTAPEVTVAGAVLTFQLVVNDGKVSSTPAIVDVGVSNVNLAPIANPGGDQSVAEGVVVTLDASASHDPDGDALYYQWRQVGGIEVTLSDATAVKPTFTSPHAIGGATLTFSLTVSDGWLESQPVLAVVTVNHSNLPPTASAGVDQTVLEGARVYLDGSQSSDPELGALQYSWTQIAGPPVTLDLSQPAYPTFLAPEVAQDGAVITLQLTVSDGYLVSAPDLVNITVTNLNQAPIANAGASQTVVEGAQVALNGAGSSDPDGNALTYYWTQVSGPTVALNLTDPAHPTFTAPSVTAATALTFQLVVSDGEASSAPAWTNVMVNSQNQVPVANAGVDQTVNEKTAVTLDGSGSLDPDGDPLTYVWRQVSGPVVTLNLDDPVHPKFTAPVVSSGGLTLSFELVVNDGLAASEPEIVNITVKHVNQAPIAYAGTTQTVRSGTVVTLDGSGSYDPDGDVISYLWTQTAGPAVTIANPTAMQPTFTAPAVTTNTTLAFKLTVKDMALSSSSTVSVVVQPANHLPVANAGSPQTVKEQTQVLLDGSLSKDADGDALRYIWKQIRGPAVALNTTDPVHPSFIAPDVSVRTELIFGLTVNDGLASSTTSKVTITVLPEGFPPICDLARAKPAQLWPPTHKLIKTSILGMSDPKWDPPMVTVTSITQDEPTSGLGDGDTAIDAIRKDGALFLRAERKLGGNGRVYQVSFSATNMGGSCSGKVSVCVPKDSKTKTCTNDGQYYNSER